MHTEAQRKLLLSISGCTVPFFFFFFFFLFLTFRLSYVCDLLACRVQRSAVFSSLYFSPSIIFSVFNSSATSHAVDGLGLLLFGMGVACCYLGQGEDERLVMNEWRNWHKALSCVVCCYFFSRNILHKNLHSYRTNEGQTLKIGNFYFFISRPGAYLSWLLASLLGEDSVTACERRGLCLVQTVSHNTRGACVVSPSLLELRMYGARHVRTVSPFDISRCGGFSGSSEALIGALYWGGMGMCED